MAASTSNWAPAPRRRSAALIKRPFVSYTLWSPYLHRRVLRLDGENDHEDAATVDIDVARVVVPNRRRRACRGAPPAIPPPARRQRGLVAAPVRGDELVNGA